VGISALIVGSYVAVGQAAGPFGQRLSNDKRIAHVLNRMTFGPRPGDYLAVKRVGVDKWIDLQLHPESIPENPVLEDKLSPLLSVRLLTWQILEKYPATPPGVAARPPSAVAYTQLTPQQVSRIVNGSLGERETTLMTLDPSTRGLVLAAAPQQALDGLPEDL